MRMTAISLITVLLSFVMALAAPAPGEVKVLSISADADPYREADDLMTFGEDAGRDRQAYAIAERALANDSNNYQWLWRATRASYFIGDNAVKNEKLAHFERGIGFGQRAVAQQPNGAEGHFWLGANYGGYSQLKGALKALQTVKLIRAEMETVLRLNDRYQDGSAYLALGEMDRELPWLFGGDLKRSVSRLEKGVQVAPANIEMKLSLAQSYKEAGRKEDARRQLQEILGRQINPARAKSEGQVQDKARKLLAKL